MTPFSAAVVLASTALVCAFLLTLVARPLATALGWVDRPDGVRKVHSRPTPLMGGLAIAATVVLVLALRTTLLPNARPFLGLHDSALGPLLLSMLMFCGVGFWDDRWPIDAKRKLLLQFVSCLPFAFFGPQIESVGLFGFTVPLGGMGTLVLILWLVTCVNVINLLDGLDGMCSSVSIVAIAGVFGLSVLQRDLNTAIVAGIVIAAIAGFLLHNRPPARIFLGDCGSLTIGFLVGALMIESPFRLGSSLQIAGPLAIMSVPLFDATMAVVRRRLCGRSLGQGDRRHIHHCLRERGLSTTCCVLTVAALGLVLAAAGAAAGHLQNDWIAFGAAAAVLGLLVERRIFGDHELRLAQAHLRAIAETYHLTAGRLRAGHNPAPRVSTGLPTVWPELHRAAVAAGGYRLEFIEAATQIPSECGVALRMLPETTSDSGPAGWEFSIRLPDPEMSGIALRVIGRADGQDSGPDLTELIAELMRHRETRADHGRRLRLPEPALVRTEAAAHTRDAA